MLRITQLNIYRVKSLAGISLETARVTDRGLEYDRRWLLMDENNIQLTQESHSSRLRPAFTRR